MKNLLSIFIFLGFTCSFFSQEGNSSFRKIKVNEISTSGFFSLDQMINGSLVDFKTLAPKSNLLNKDFTNYSNPNYSNNKTTNAAFSVLLGIQFANKDKSAFNENSTFRVGINYSQRTIMSSNLDYENRVSYDTLTSSQGSQTIIFDSIYSSNYIMDYVHENLRVDMSYIYRINPASRLSFYTGIGITTGLIFNAKTNIQLTNKIRTESHYPTDFQDVVAYKENSIISNESFQNKNSFGISGYLPIGIDFQLSAKKDILKHLHLFYEMRAEINAITIPELTSYFNARSQHGFGLRILF